MKKTLKGDLMGKTGFKAVKQARASKGTDDGTDPGAAPPAAQQTLDGPGRRSLDALLQDDVVVITEPLRPRDGRPIPLGAPESRRPAPRPDADPVEQKAVAAVAFQPMQDGAALPLARAVLAEGLYKDLGAKGSKMQHPTGTTFHLNPTWADGVVHTQRNVVVPLQAGHAAAHQADLVLELDNRAMLVLDIVASSVTPTEMKALAFDALQLHQMERCFTVLVFVRTPGTGMPQEQAEALGHGYDFAFGIDEADVHSELKFASLRNRIQTWLAAASGKRKS
ncbi:MAG: hypothetical protein LC623_08675 [Halobacteriales archaeon]|nr:hypothetical protein [Halobacteriales archaeon]